MPHRHTPSAARGEDPPAPSAPWVRAPGTPAREAFPPDAVAAPVLRRSTEACAGDRPFRHDVILIHAVSANPDGPQQSTVTMVDRLAPGEGDDAMMAEPRPVIASADPRQGPKRIRIPDTKQRCHPGIRPNVRRDCAAGAIGAG